MPGPVPKPESKRRQANKPRSYGDAEATTAPAAQSVADRQLGIQNAHPLIASIWDTVQSSCESAFYSESDWARLRMELWFADHTMASGRPSGQAWAVIQDGMNAMWRFPGGETPGRSASSYGRRLWMRMRMPRCR